MSRTLWAALICLGAAAAAQAAAPPAETPTTRRVAALIELLGDRDFRAREVAERRLRAEGAAALPLLRKALRHEDLEVRRRALRLVPSIETEVTFAPKLVTMRVVDQPLKAVLSALGKASGYSLTDAEVMRFNPRGIPNPNAKAPDPAKDKTFSYDFVSVPFWDAVDRVCRDAGLSVYQQPYVMNDETVRFTKNEGYSPFTCRHGPFRVTANSLQGLRNVELNTAKMTEGRSEKLTLEFTVFAEPRLPLMHLGEPRLESAYDELKNSMLARKETVEQFDTPFGRRNMGFGRRQYSPGYKQLAMQTSLPLERTSERATTLKRVKGTVPLTVLIKQEPVVIAEKVMAAKGLKQEIGDLTFEVQDVTQPAANQVTLKLSIVNKRGGDYTWQNSLYNRLEMLDEVGNKMQTWGSSWGGSGPNNVMMTLTYMNRAAKPGQPGRFTFQHWETKTYDVDFDFRDVPLP